MNILKEQRKPRLLAIDDSPMIHRLLKARLKDERLEIHCATDGPSGLQSAQSLLPDVILLDIDMPGMDGFEVLTRLKTMPATHEIPVIFLSGSRETSAIVRGLEMGAIDFVAKPFDVNELKARVRSALRIHLLITMLAQRAQLDGLTGLWNRAHFDQRLEEEIASARRHNTPLALILCDLDRFKILNDTYGHPFGDSVLEEFAQLLGQGRAGDVACRYGGEEFAAILPRSNVEDATAVAERLRLGLRQHTWTVDPKLVVTASFGVTDLSLLAEPSVRAMVDSADHALYSAKQRGRDRVVSAAAPSTSVRLTA